MNKALPPQSARVNTVRAFADGDYVFAHTDYHFFGPNIGELLRGQSVTD
jgi:hypothetical protein